MPITFNGKKYSSFKHPMLERIFNDKTSNGTVGLGDNHAFTLGNISTAYAECGIGEPASISNTILDLTRKNSGIKTRLPQSIISHGYDLRKKTGPAPNGGNYAGEFVHVGVGNVIGSWLVWPKKPDKEVLIENKVPHKIADLLGNDEGAMFSVIDYCDVLSHALNGEADTVLRVQNPMKWQPNEIDGLYFSDHGGDARLIPIEAKALSTNDDINLEQMLGAYKTIRSKRPNNAILPLAAKMIPNGINLGVLVEGAEQLDLHRFIQVTFKPPIGTWQ